MLVGNVIRIKLVFLLIVVIIIRLGIKIYSYD